MNLNPILAVSERFNLNAVLESVNDKGVTKEKKTRLEIKTKHGTFVRPVIETFEFNRTMRAFREAKYLYNRKAGQHNAFAKKFNADLEAVREKSFSKADQKMVSNFALIMKQDEGNKVCIWERIDRIKKFNKGREGQPDQYPYPKIPTLKSNADQAFSAFLFHAKRQLRIENKRRDKFNVYSALSLPAIDVNSYHLTTTTSDGVVHWDVSQRTFYRHRDRFLDAGILVDKQAGGHKKACKVYIAPHILHVRDAYEDQQAVIEDQLVNSEKKTKCQDKLQSNTSINKYQIKENVDNSNSQLNEFSQAQTDNNNPTDSTHADLYKNSKVHDAKNLNSEAEKKEKISAKKEKTLSDSLLEVIEPDNWEFGQKLARGEFHNYKVIKLKYLEKEAKYGTLTREEFRRLVMQDFFKSASVLWKDKTAYAGAWTIAINLWDYNKLLSLDKSVSMNKRTLLDKVTELRWRLKWVKNYARKKPDWNILFPNEYFDPTRRKAREGGFEFTYKKYKASKKAKIKNEQEAKYKASLRRIKSSDVDKATKLIRQHYAKKFDLRTLFEKVSRLNNRELNQKLPELIQKYAQS